MKSINKLGAFIIGILVGVIALGVDYYFTLTKFDDFTKSAVADSVKNFMSTQSYNGMYHYEYDVWAKAIVINTEDNDGNRISYVYSSDTNSWEVVEDWV